MGSKGFLIFVAMAGIAFSPAQLGAAELDQERCLCDALPGDPPRNGAAIRNATACWSIEDQQREWCDIVVESVAGAASSAPMFPGSNVAGTGPVTTVAAVETRFRRFIRDYARSRGTEPALADLAEARRTMKRLLSRNQDLLAQCIQKFSGEALGKGFHREGSEGVICRVGEKSGWLHLRLAVAGFWLTYMAAPPGSR